MQWSCIGHEQEKAYLQRLLNEGRLAHAYLFVGPDGIGKRMVAQDMMRALVGEGPTMDVMRLMPERDSDGDLHEIPVKAAEELRTWLALRPSGRYKSVLIDDADRLGTKTGDMLLKTLEEPPAYAHFFLITSRPGSVLPTIISRCEQVEFRPLDDADFRAALGTQKLDADDRALLATVAGGCPGIALRLIEKKKLPIAAKAIAALQEALAGGIVERFALAKDVAASPDADDIITWWLTFVHGRLPERPTLAPIAAGLLEVSEAFTQTGINRRLALEHFFLEVD